MRTRDFAAKHIRFEKTSPVTGPFRLAMYPFLGKPMDAADDIRIKRLVIFKASSCLGTVLGQVINAKRIACDVGDQKMVCQTDSDAATWTKTRGKEWLESIPSVMRLLKSDKYAQTQDLWLFRHKFLEISGPGINSAQSVQVRYVQTDESHLEAYPNGRLVEFEKRMGARFDRQSTHITTAPDEGREVDQFFYEGTQEEWHWRCTKCANLVWPLWEEAAKAHYNGETVFKWIDSQSETESLESIKAYCPHCGKDYRDKSRDRFSLQRDADYVSKNPNAPIECASFRWAAFAAAHWMPWREFLSEHFAAMRAARMGDLKPHEDFVKKRECRSYRPEIPDLGEGCGSNDYKVGSAWIVQEDQLGVCSFDVQSQGGRHFWAQADTFTHSGASRRLAYARLDTWGQCRDFQKTNNILGADTYCDAGHEPREVFSHCEEWGWTALLSTDDQDFIHFIPNPKGKSHPKIAVRLPYSGFQAEDAMIGKSGQRVQRYAKVPAGHCLSRRWSKPVVGGYLMSAKAGNGRYYGIASDISPDFTAQINSYTYATKRDKVTGKEVMFLKQIKTQDHAFSTASQCLLGAIIKGFFPLSETETTQEKAA